MSPVQQKIYNFILKYREKHGFVPSIGAIAKQYGVTTQTIQQVLTILTKKGYIKRSKYIPRGNYEVIHSLSTQTGK